MAVMSQWPRHAPGCPQAQCPACQACTTCADRGGGVMIGGDGKGITLANAPSAGFWTSRGREKDGDATLQAVLQRVAINDEVLVAGATHSFCFYTSIFFSLKLCPQKCRTAP